MNINSVVVNNERLVDLTGKPVPTTTGGLVKGLASGRLGQSADVLFDNDVRMWVHEDYLEVLS